MEKVGGVTDEGANKDYGAHVANTDHGESFLSLNRSVLMVSFIQPFFWAFTTLQIVLHSARIFSGFVRGLSTPLSFSRSLILNV